MNLQKDLIQHISVLTVAPGYLNFAMPRSSNIVHVGLEELQLLLRDCMGVLAVEPAEEVEDLLSRTGEEQPPALAGHFRMFREVSARADELLHTSWQDDLSARDDIESVIGELDAFLSREHWYELDRARLIRMPGGVYYHNCSPAGANLLSNWHCASLFFSEESADAVCGTLYTRFGLEGEVVPVSEFDPPKDYLWRARTYAPQSPQSMINYWEAVLPGSRRVRIRQMVDQSV